ncbi:MAG: indole-3-glycerol phosphate synthase TrpC [Bacteroidales bacterium]|jgi:indole-3-glycerol phosphate synthase|nr:indole-3-glycerol phosphate synthase TrpC [Bacteroidales bacterium]
MTILDNIIATKKTEIAERKNKISISDLEETAAFGRKCLSLRQSLLHSTSGIIAEFKRKSPSKGWIHADADVQKITSGYSQNGASGISILTDFPYFGGAPDDLISARPNIHCPVLRKDFMIDEYQLFEAKSYGADVVLLIAAALTIAECKNLAQKAKQLGLETLLEVHNAEELKHINEYIDLVGVNNRNLKTFEVSTAISIELAQLIPDEFVKISESGISNVQTVRELQQIGYKGFLMGENFMKEENPADALKQFIAEL